MRIYLNTRFLIEGESLPFPQYKLPLGRRRWSSEVPESHPYFAGREERDGERYCAFCGEPAESHNTLATDSDWLYLQAAYPSAYAESLT
jgi:hypothetical protein